MIGQLACRGGVVGIVPFNAFLKPDWKRGDPKDDVSVKLVAQAIDHVAQLTGSSAHVGLGTDFDGGFGAESIPAEMDTVADLHLIGEALSDRGYTSADIERIMNGNWLRILESSFA
jgi:membrane dipeptidase